MFDLKKNTVTFTGRRPKDLFGYKEEDKYKYKLIVDALELKLIDLYNVGYRIFISGGAQGFDQLAFWTVNRLKKKGYNVKNILYIPFEGQEKNWVKSGLFSQEEYNTMILLADEVRYIVSFDKYRLKDEHNQIIKNNFLYLNKIPKYEISAAMTKRNNEMVDNSSLVIGLYPSDMWKMPTTRGGTSQCLRYAYDKKTEILQMNPFNCKFEEVA